jgi:hypothetical protein
LGFLEQTIHNTEAEIDRLFETTVVSGEVRQADPLFFNPFAMMNNIIHRSTVERIIETGYVENLYIEAGFPWLFLIPAAEGGRFPGDVYDDFIYMFEHYIQTEYGYPQERINPLFAVNDFGKFLEEFGEGIARAVPGLGIEGAEDIVILPDYVDIRFGQDFGESDFVYDDAGMQTPIPAILSYHTLETFGLVTGDIAFVSSELFHDLDWTYPIQIIGVHNRGIARSAARDAILIPLSALEQIRGEETGYITFRFDINPANNRNLDAVAAAMRSIVNTPLQRNLLEVAVFLNDEELRFVVGQMERNLSLLRLLRPIAVVVAVVIGLGLSLLTLMQDTKKAAVLRVLGQNKTRTRIMLAAENFVVSLAGAVLGSVIMLFIGVNLTLLAALYLGGTLIGASVGAYSVSNRPPLDLLQVRE